VYGKYILRTEKKMSFIVAIDGPAGTGKGTMASRLSKKYNLVNIDTGATYRCVTLEMMNQNIGMDEEEKIAEMLKSIQIELSTEKGKQKVFLNGQDVTDKIRSKEVSANVSPVSSIKQVRLAMGGLQRKMAQGKDVIMEGRDIGTVIFPNADVKIYLDANVEVRAKRRVKQNEEKGIEMSYEEVLENIKKRDKNDMEKEMGALKVAEDAVVIDGSEMTIKEVEKAISNVIDKKLKEKKEQEKIYWVRPETTWKKIERATIKAILHAFYKVVFRIEKINEENLPMEGPVIVCANHLNTWDAIGLVTASKRRIRFIAKEELFHNKFLNWFAHVFDVIPVKRGMRDIEAMKMNLTALKNGEALGLFPEGTRKGLAKGAKVQNGAAYMALKTKTKVVPVGIQGTFKPFTKVKLNYGKPLDYTNYEPKNPEKEDIEKATKEIMDSIIMLTNQAK
jgi:cytidylate kinase